MLNSDVTNPRMAQPPTEVNDKIAEYLYRKDAQSFVHTKDDASKSHCPRSHELNQSFVMYSQFGQHGSCAELWYRVNLTVALHFLERLF